MINKFSVIWDCSRVFALPMTIMAWLIIFTYSAAVSGNIIYGLVALLAVCLVHMSANILDDFFDYKSLIKQVGYDKIEYLKNSQKTKCRYLVSGYVKENEILLLACAYLFIAGLIGLFFYVKCGFGVVYFTLIGAFIAIFYSFMSKIRLSEIAIGTAFGPALFGGVYYVMTKTYSWEIYVLSIPTLIITVILLYIHSVMDYEYDLNEGHYTIANSFDSQLDALVVLKWLLIAAYVTPLFTCIFDILDWQICLVWLTIPLAIDLYKSMVLFATEPNSAPEHRWFHFPMENMRGAPSFMIRMYQARNLCLYYSILFSCAVLLSLN